MNNIIKIGLKNKSDCPRRRKRILQQQLGCEGTKKNKEKKKSTLHGMHAPYLAHGDVRTQ